MKRLVYCRCTGLGSAHVEQSELTDDLTCIRCGSQFHGCRYCPGIYYHRYQAREHMKMCPARTVLDDIVDALELANSGLMGTYE